jgi:hypothetical protein
MANSGRPAAHRRHGGGAAECQGLLAHSRGRSAWPAAGRGDLATWHRWRAAAEQRRQWRSSGGGDAGAMAAMQQQWRRRRSSGNDTAAAAAAMELKLGHGERALQRARESEARQRERRVRELGARAWLNGGQGDAGGCISVASIGRSERSPSFFPSVPLARSLSISLALAMNARARWQSCSERG